jgi:hypothetical protein
MFVIDKATFPAFIGAAQKSSGGFEKHYNGFVYELFISQTKYTADNKDHVNDGSGTACTKANVASMCPKPDVVLCAE